MAQYQTGTAASPTALKTIIETFCTDNGFSLASGWLSKNQSHINLNTSVPGGISTITRAGTLATCVCNSPHALVTGMSITIAGASDSLYNGTYSITVINTTQFTYTMAGSPAASPATGTITATGHPTVLTVVGANSADGLTELSPNSDRINVALASWPITYYLFYSGTPDQVCCVIRHDVTKFQHIMFGEIVKVHTSAFVGGNWFWATRGLSVGLNTRLDGLSDTLLTGGRYQSGSITTGSVVPFSGSQTVVADNELSGSMHAKLDTTVWAKSYSNGSIALGDIYYTTYTIKSLFRSPNTWNSQALLVPMHLKVRMASTLDMYIGYIEHVRLIRVDNYEPGDIITLGSDQWKVFPAVEKNSAARNGETAETAHSGTVGFAIRYVP